MYHIANYKSRGTRSYQLPFERADDPVLDFRRKFTKMKMEAMQQKKVDNEIKFKQPGIRRFFAPKQASTNTAVAAKQTSNNNNVAGKETSESNNQNELNVNDEEKKEDPDEETDDEWVLALLVYLDNGSQID